MCKTQSTGSRARVANNGWLAAIFTLLDSRRHACQGDVVRLNTALRDCRRAGRWQHVLTFLKSATCSLGTEPDIVTHNTALTSLGSRKLWQASLALLAALGNGSDIFSFNSLLGTLDNVEQWCWVLQMFRDVRQRRMGDAVTYTSSLRAASKRSRWAEGLDLLQDAQAADIELDLTALNSVANVFEQGSAWMQSSCLLARLPLTTTRPDDPLYNSVLRALGECNRWRDALSSRVTMDSQRISPTTITCNSILRSCADGKWPIILVQLRSFREAAVEADTVTCNTALSMGRYSAWAAMCELLRGARVATVKADTFTYGAACRAFENAGRWQSALLLTQEFTVKARLRASLTVMNSAISACKAAAEWEQALRLLSDLQAQQLLPDAVTYASAIAACEKGSRWVFALLLYEDMALGRVDPDLVVFGSLVSACGQSRNGAMVKAFLESLERRSLEPNLVVANAAITALARCGEWEEASSMLAELLHGSLRLDAITYNAVLNGHAGRGKWSEALGLLAEMCCRGLEPDVVSHSSALSACEEGLRWTQALTNFLHFRGRGLECGIIPHNAAIAALASGARWLQGMEAMAKLKQQGSSATEVTLNSVVSACQRGRQWQVALLLCQGLHASSLRLDPATHNAAILVCAACGQWLSTIDLLQDLHSARHAIDSVAHAAVIDACETNLQHKHAAMLLDAMAEAAVAEVSHTRAHRPGPISGLRRSQGEKARCRCKLRMD